MGAKRGPADVPGKRLAKRASAKRVTTKGPKGTRASRGPGAKPAAPGPRRAEGAGAATPKLLAGGNPQHPR